jgi:sulfatase modifying factor 1
VSRARAAKLVVVVALAYGCGLFPDLSGLGGNADGGLGGDAATCQGEAGPPGVAVGPYCVDSTEVTNAEYAAFVASKPDPTQQVAACSWNTSFAQSPAPPVVAADLPAVWLDWCDARAYCAWAGKRLCGAIGGAAQVADAAALVNAASDEWYQACSKGGAFTYPYGAGYDSARCNVPDNDAGALLSASATATCSGGYAGIVDMVGNADEWENACESGSADASDDPCTRRSGSFMDPVGTLQTCAFSRVQRRGGSDSDIGFRCCADVR